MRTPFFRKFAVSMLISEPGGGTGQVPPAVLLEKVTRVYGSGSQAVHALRGIDLEVPRSSLAIIKGRSGSGKTTMLNLIGGLDQPTSGRVLVNGEDISRFSERKLTLWRRTVVGFVFQSFGLLPSLTALENVELPMRIVGLKASQRRKRAMECLHLVGLTKRAHHRILELSGGEQQRVSIARALVNRPQLILADEPTGELDHNTAMKVMLLFRQLVEEQGVTICLVTHDPAVEEFGDYVYSIEDGRIGQRINRRISPAEAASAAGSSQSR